MKEKYTIKISEDITSAIKAIREEVFIKEQNIPEEKEFEDDEAMYTHFCLFANDTPAACTRMLCKDNVVKIMRVAVLKNFRGLGLGNRIMLFTENEARKRKCKKAVVDSQVQSKDFYAKLGYRVEGQEFLDADIPHIKMTKKI